MPMISQTIDGSSDIGAGEIFYIVACVFEPADTFMLLE